MMRPAFSHDAAGINVFCSLLLSTSDSRIKGSWQLLVLSFACIYFDPKIQHTFMVTWS